MPTTSGPTRQHHLDNLRTALTALVICHHSAIPYGGLGSWSYTSSLHRSASSLPLMAFNALDQTFFMGMFFLLSGAMSASSLRRKRRRAFLGSKCLKLGLPVVVYTLLGKPFEGVVLKLVRDHKLDVREVVSYWKDLRGIRGPVWYLGLLLIFDTLFSFLPPPFLESLNRIPQWAVVTADVAASFLVRLRFPAGKAFVPLNLQLGFLPQYVVCYFLGAVRGSASPVKLTRTMRRILVLGSVVSTASIMGLLYAYPEHYTLNSVAGGSNLLALSYAVWNETTGYMLGNSILHFFRSSKRLSQSWGTVNRYSYAAFLVHPIVCVGIQGFADGWVAGGVLKTVVLGTVGVLGSWGVGWGLLRLPGVGSVLA